MLESVYNEVLEVINDVEDDEEREAFLSRAAYKYELLSGEVADAWADAQNQIDAVKGRHIARSCLTARLTKS